MLQPGPTFLVCFVGAKLLQVLSFLFCKGGLSRAEELLTTRETTRETTKEELPEDCTPLQKKKQRDGFGFNTQCRFFIVPLQKALVRWSRTEHICVFLFSFWGLEWKEEHRRCAQCKTSLPSQCFLQWQQIEEGCQNSYLLKPNHLPQKPKYTFLFFSSEKQKSKLEKGTQLTKCRQCS